METYKRSSKRRSDPEQQTEKRSVVPFFQGELFKQWILPILITVAVVIFIRVFILDLIFVEGTSMNSTLESRDLMVVTKVERLFMKPSSGDVIVCKYPDATGLYVKRVIAVGGDTVMLKDGVTYVNNEPIDEPYVDSPSTETFGPKQIPEGHVMVMGDNRRVSLDSRASSVGPLPESSIVGYARAVVLPFSHFGKIN